MKKIIISAIIVALVCAFVGLIGGGSYLFMNAEGVAAGIEPQKKETLYLVVYESFHPMTGTTKGLDVIKYGGDIATTEGMKIIENSILGEGFTEDTFGQINFLGYVKMETLTISE